MKTYAEIAKEIDTLADKQDAVPQIAAILAENAGANNLTVRLVVSMSKKQQSLIASDQLRQWPEEHASLLETIIPNISSKAGKDTYPCSPRDLAIANVLADQTVPKKVRAHVWKAFVMNGTKFPSWQQGEEWNVPDELQDHPSVRSWICSVKRPGWEDLRYSDPFLFKGNNAANFKTESEQKALSAIQKDSPSGLLMPLSIEGIELNAKYDTAILAVKAMKITLYLYSNNENFRHRIQPRSLLFYICANWNDDATIPFVTLLEKDNPGLVKFSIDELGHDALWYTLYQRDRFYKATQAARRAMDPLDKELISLGCDPDRKNIAGLSYHDLTE